MANPFLVLGGIAVGVVTAAFGVLQVPGWVASAQDAAAVNDLSNIRESQSVQQATYSAFTSDVNEVTGANGDTAGASFSLDNATLTHFGASDDGAAFCATIKSDSGSFFATSEKGITTDGATSATAAMDAAGCDEGTRKRAFHAEQIVFRIDTTAAGCVTPGIHLEEGTGTIEWGDGSATEEGELRAAQHTYGEPGVYDIVVTGTFKETGLMPAGAAPCLVEVPHWGSKTGVKRIDHLFDGATNLTAVVTPPRGITSMARTFADAVSFDQPLDRWDVSRVINMSSMFAGATSFNQPLAGWQTGEVRYMGGIFLAASSFNQPLDEWDVSNIVDLSNAFNGAVTFNQPLGSWDVGNARAMSWMFSAAKSFSQDLSTWKNDYFAADPSRVNIAEFKQDSKLTPEQLPSWMK